MIYDTLISTNDLAVHLHDPDWAVVDCRFSLEDPERGRKAYLQSHIPGAVYAHLEEDLSAVVVPGVTGRHPLPGVADAAIMLGKLGIDAGIQVVAYDDAGGGMAAARLWWMLRWLGHQTVAVLDGGWQRWVEEGRPQTAGEVNRESRVFLPAPRPELLATTQEVEAARDDPSFLVVDARSPERYRGESEPIDPVAGHIPGAVNAPYTDNLAADRTFRSKEALRQTYQNLLGNVRPEGAIFYCGSGVTSILDILGMMHAGMGEGRLYAGSWSEWITDPERPVAKGRGEGG